MKHAAGSDWDIFESAEHNCDYYHNRVTGETSWTCPPELVAALASTTPHAPATQHSSDSLDHLSAEHSGSEGYEHQQSQQPRAGVFKEFLSPEGYVFYRDVVGGALTWTLPEGKSVWKECTDGDGYVFFSNRDTGEVAWEVPADGVLLEESHSDVE